MDARAATRKVKEKLALRQMKSKRVAYIAFHKAGRDVELPVFRNLGFEVYTIKKFDAGHRSGAFDFSDDENISIPAKVVDYLNSVNFIDSTEWPPLAIHYLNEYFDWIFVIQNHNNVYNALRYFNGKILVRLAGLDYPKSYTNYWNRNEPRLMPLARARENDLWFSIQYENLPGVEDEIFARRSVFMPLGMPSFAKENVDTWRGTNRTLVSVLPWIHLPYYQHKYRSALRHIEDRPILFLGDQPHKSNDARVLGFLSKEAFVKTLQDARGLFYESYEPRHVHFPPFEAAAMGLPVLFPRGCLLHELAGGDVPGSFGSEREFREKADLLLAGDRAFVAEVRASQGEFLSWFADDFVDRKWREAFRLMETARPAVSDRPLSITPSATIPQTLLHREENGDATINVDFGPVSPALPLLVSASGWKPRTRGGRLSIAVTNLVEIDAQSNVRVDGEREEQRILSLFNGPSDAFGRNTQIRIEGGLDNLGPINVAPGVVELDELVCLRQGSRQSASLILKGYALDNHWGIDVIDMDAEVAFAASETLIDADAVDMMLGLDHHRYSWIYNVTFTLNDEVIWHTTSEGLVGVKSLPVEGRLKRINRLGVKIDIPPRCEKPTRMPTVHFNMIRFGTRG